jgi:phosphopantetheine--protein transferase-like protein
MNIITGIDIVDIERFKKILEADGESFLKRVFTGAERSVADPAHLAGIFAAKEAVKKAFDLIDEIWKEIEVKKLPSGKPEIVLHINPEFEIISMDASISHEAGIAAASFVALIDGKNNQ